MTDLLTAAKNALNFMIRQGSATEVEASDLRTAIQQAEAQPSPANEQSTGISSQPSKMESEFNQAVQRGQRIFPSLQDIAPPAPVEQREPIVKWPKIAKPNDMMEALSLIAQLCRRIDELEDREIAPPPADDADKLDAERYRFMRRIACLPEYSYDDAVERFFSLPDDFDDESEPCFDAWVDSAMRGKEE